MDNPNENCSWILHSLRNDWAYSVKGDVLIKNTKKYIHDLCFKNFSGR